MEQPTASTRELVRFAWPVLVAQLALMANAVIDTAMAGRLTVIDLAAVGIAASIMATILMSLVSVLFALPPIISHLYGAGRQAEIGREIHQGVWVSLVLALVAVLPEYAVDLYFAWKAAAPRAVCVFRKRGSPSLPAIWTSAWRMASRR